MAENIAENVEKKVSSKAKAPIIIFIVLIMISLGFAGLSFYYLQQEYQKNTALTAELNEVQVKYTLSEKKLQQSQKTISELEVKLDETKQLIGSLEDDLNKTIEEKQDALSRAKELESSLAGQIKLRADLENKLIEAEGESKRVREQVQALESQKTELETKLKELQEKSSQAVELGKIVVGPAGQDLAEALQQVIEPKPVEEQPEKPVSAETNPQQTKTASDRLTGKVLIVNKEYNFAVINLGSKDGIEVDSVFSVYRSKKYIGDLKIEKVHESMAAAGFLSPKIKDRINEGDRVVQKRK